MLQVMKVLRRKGLDKGQAISIFLFIGLVILVFTPIGSNLKLKFDEYTLSPAQIKKISDITFASENWQIPLRAYNGFTDTNLEKMKGKVTFINFWGTWCGPCVAEMPSMQKLYDAKKEEVNFLFIARSDKPEKINAFLKKTNYSFPVYEAIGDFSKEFTPPALPTTYILNKEGKIVLVERGAADWNAPEVHTLLDELIAEINP